MTITWNWPVPGNDFGPGFALRALTDVVGPFPTGTAWVLKFFYPTTSEFPFIEMSRVPDDAHVLETRLLIDPSVTPTVVFPNLVGRPDVRVQATVQAPDGTVYDSGTVDVKWNLVEGQLAQVLAQPKGTGGLTPDQAAQLADIALAVTRQLTQGGNQVAIDVNALVAHPPLGALIVQDIVFLIDGEGFFDLPQLSGVFAYGAWWEFTTVPPGVGRLEGPTVRYLTRAMQLRTIHTIGGVDFVTEVLDVDFQRVVWTWREALPKQLQYSVTPGFEVAMHFLVSPI